MQELYFIIEKDLAESFIRNWNNSIKKVKTTREFKAPYSTLKGFPIEFENYGSDSDGVVVVGTHCIGIQMMKAQLTLIGSNTTLIG